MSDSTTFLVDQAHASAHTQFVYDLTAQRVTYVNKAYEHVLGGHQARVNEELPALLTQLHPDDVPVWSYYWRMWTKGQLQEEVEFRLLLQLTSPSSGFA